jgi:hypothetical protein
MGTLRPFRVRGLQIMRSAPLTRIAQARAIRPLPPGEVPRAAPLQASRRIVILSVQGRILTTSFPGPSAAREPGMTGRWFCGSLRDMIGLPINLRQ